MGSLTMLEQVQIYQHLPFPLFLFTHTISSLDVVDRSNVAVALWWSIRRESEGVGFDEGLVGRLFYRYFLFTFTPRSC